MSNSKDMIETGELLIDYRPFNPLDKKILGKCVADAAVETSVSELPPKEFIGAGVYLLYYEGDFPLYRKIADNNRNGAYNAPIYIGKAVPNGARKGGFGDNPNPGKVLYKRLQDHAKSIIAAENLELGDFKCRYLAVDDIWIPLAESLLIDRFSPVWNLALEGFGNHDPGKGRTNGKKPLWDVIHPGRDWAEVLKPNPQSPKEIEKQVLSFIDSTY